MKESDPLSARVTPKAPGVCLPKCLVCCSYNPGESAGHPQTPNSRRRVAAVPVHTGQVFPTENMKYVIYLFLVRGRSQTVCCKRLVTFWVEPGKTLGSLRHLFLQKLLQALVAQSLFSVNCLGDFQSPSLKLSGEGWILQEYKINHHNNTETPQNSSEAGNCKQQHPVFQ